MQILTKIRLKECSLASQEKHYALFAETEVLYEMNVYCPAEKFKKQFMPR